MVVSLGAGVTPASAQVRVAVVFGGNMTGPDCAAQLNDDTFFDFEASAVGAADVDEAGELAQYDAVILGDGGNRQAAYTPQMFAAIREWMDQGGGVVSVGWYNYGTDTYQGQMALDADYVAPFLDGPYRFLGRGGTLEILDDSHPITAGIASFNYNGNNLEWATALDENATRLGRAGGQADSVAVAYQEENGRSVYLGGLYLAQPGYNNGGLRSGIEDQLLEQAVAWAGGGGTSCNYRLKKDTKSKGGCEACPSGGDVISSGVECEESADCAKKLRGTIPCPDRGPGVCKKVKGKRTDCS
ncbi:MAG: hypothetical protein C4547_05815 [Phycisphaerales bacterium]|nr:MAG: hypothetical protein C4547_05815 [Phycisphaerales bacterium]